MKPIFSCWTPIFFFWHVKTPHLKPYFTIVLLAQHPILVTIDAKAKTSTCGPWALPDLPLNPRDGNIDRTLSKNSKPWVSKSVFGRFYMILDDFINDSTDSLIQRVSIFAPRFEAPPAGDSRLGLLADCGAGWQYSAAQQQEFAARKEKMLHLRCPRMHQK